MLTVTSRSWMRPGTPLTVAFDTAPAAVVMFTLLSPSNTMGVPGVRPPRVETVSDQLRSVPVLPPASSTTTSAHGPAAAWPMAAPIASSGWIVPVGVRSTKVRFRTFAADGVPGAWSSNVVPANTSSKSLPLSLVSVMVLPPGDTR
jgi:hypothetical protein